MKVVDKKLYAQVKAEADAKFIALTSIYKSAWIVRQYKKRGGLFEEDSKPNTKTGLLRWFEEKWINLNKPGSACGRPHANTRGEYPLCRPTVKVTDATPVLAQELNKKDLQEAKKRKQQLKNKGRLPKIQGLATKSTAS